MLVYLTPSFENEDVNIPEQLKPKPPKPEQKESVFSYSVLTFRALQT